MIHERELHVQYRYGRHWHRSLHSFKQLEHCFLRVRGGYSKTDVPVLSAEAPADKSANTTHAGIPLS